jgi:hypothetical protein
MMRAGRIDTLIVMDSLNEESGLGFINRYTTDGKGNSLLSPDEDYTSAAQSLAGVVPAFAMDILQKAKTYRFIQMKDYVLPEFIISAAENSKKHQSLAQVQAKHTPKEAFANQITEVFKYLNGTTDDALKNIYDEVCDIQTRL